MFGFELVLYYPAGTSTRFDDDNLIIKGNMGNSYTEIWWREGQASQNCYAGNYLDDNIEGAGITGFGGRILGNFPPGVTHLTIEVTEFGQVKNAQWKIDVP